MLIILIIENYLKDDHKERMVYMTKMLEINTTKCRMYFTEEELFSLMSQDKDLLTTGIQRGKAFKRAADQRKGWRKSAVISD